MKRQSKILGLLFLLLCSYTFSAFADGTSPLAAHYFFTPGCPLCEPANRAVERAAKEFEGRIIFYRHNLDGDDKQKSKQEFRTLIAALNHYGRKDTPKLSLFVGEECIANEDIHTDLSSKLNAILKAGKPTPDFKKKFNSVSDEQIIAISENSGRYSLPIVAVAALADGFNPCAFATVILFVSMLGTVGRERKTILMVGISFILAVFLAYFAIGLGLYHLFATFDKYVNPLALAIKWIALAMVAVAGILSLIDAFRALRSGGKQKMLLVLPESLKNRIRKRLRATAHGHSLIIGAFTSGIIISFLEAACTGQVYFPLLASLAEEQPARAYMLLLLYNLIFIVPLLAVFIMAFYGMTSEQIGNMSRKNVWVTKAALSAVFITIAVWLGSTLLPTIGIDVPNLVPTPNAPAATSETDPAESTPENTKKPEPENHEVPDDVDR